MVAQARNYTNFNTSLPRMIASDSGYVTAWRYEVKLYTPDEVRLFCVLDANWQEFRVSLKGLSTYTKLANLEHWRMKHAEQSSTQSGIEKLPRRVEVQIDNYINALKRGGQLDINCKVKR